MREETPDPIDAKIKALSEKDPSTHGQMHALDEGYKLWDAELNRVYKETLAAIAPGDRAAFVSSQKAWLNFRDREFDLQTALLFRLRGTMYGPIRIARRMEIVRQRALQLRDLREFVRDHTGK